MDLNKLQSNAVYDKESGALGNPVSLDLLERTVTILVDEDETVVADLSNIELVEIVGKLGEIVILDGDVLLAGTNKYEVELQEDGENLVLYLLNEQYERTKAGEPFGKETLYNLSDIASLEANIREIEVEEVPTVDFNIRVVRKIEDGEVTYFYACNNKELEEVDLIKVTYIGHMILEEEDYSRTTVSHDEYLEMIADEDFKEVNPQELGNYVLGMSPTTINSSEGTIVKIDTPSYTHEEEEGDFCQECGANVEDIVDCLCDCHPSW